MRVLRFPGPALVSTDFLGLRHLKLSSGIPTDGPIPTWPPGVGRGSAVWCARTPSGDPVKMQILIQEVSAGPEMQF